MKHVLFIGDATHAEFQSAVTWLREYCDWTACDSPTSALEWRRRQCQIPDVVVLAEARPGVFQQADVQLLQATFPDSRLVGLLGTWCEGELRTGTPWQGIRRFYWPHFLPHMVRDLAAASQPRIGSGTILIQTASTEAFHALADACAVGGFCTVRFQAGRQNVPPSVLGGLWDCQQSIWQEAAELARFVQQLDPAPVVALIGFPRRDDEALAITTGATAVMSKPYLVEDLLSEIIRVAHRSSPETHSVR